MDKLTKLAKEYKKTKDSKICQEIFTLLDKTIKDKANYMFYKQKFIKDKNITYTMEIFDKDSKTFKEKEIPSCFRLCDIKKFDLEDIIQELNLLILELLNNYDARRPFKNYLFYTLKVWKPYCIKDVNFIKRLDDTNESELPIIDEQEVTLNILGSHISKEPIELEDLFENLTEIEKKVINLKRVNPKINQSQIAKNIGVTQQRISQILTNLKKKCKYDL